MATNLTSLGRKNLRQLIEDNCTDRVREAYDYRGESHWLDSIADDGFLEIEGRYTKNGIPVTYHFDGEEVQS